MKIKLDENLPIWLVPALTKLGHQVDTVRDEGLVGEADTVIWAATQAEGRFLVTQDLDFADMRRYASTPHAGVAIIRLYDADVGHLVERVVALFSHEPVETWVGCLVVITERKVRVYRPHEAA